MSIYYPITNTFIPKGTARGGALGGLSFEMHLPRSGYQCSRREGVTLCILKYLHMELFKCWYVLMVTTHMRTHIHTQFCLACSSTLSGLEQTGLSQVKLFSSFWLCAFATLAYLILGFCFRAFFLSFLLTCWFCSFTWQVCIMKEKRLETNIMGRSMDWICEDGGIRITESSNQLLVWYFITLFVT